MTPEFWIGLAIGLVIASAALLVHVFRRRPGEIRDWSEEAYQPRHAQPRAITRIQSSDIDWEIRP